MSSIEPTVDELEEQLAAITDPREKIGVLFQLCKLLGLKEATRNYAYAEQALALATEIQDKYWIGRSLYALSAYDYQSTGSIVTVSSLERAVDIFDEIGEKKLYYHASYSLGLFYKELGRYSEAVNIFNKVNIYFDEVGDENNLLQSLYIVGVLQRKQGEWQKSLESAFRILSIGTAGTLPAVIYKGYDLLTSIYSDMEEYEKALQYSLRALALIETHSVVPEKDKGILLRNIGLDYYHLDDLDMALQYFLQARNIFRDGNRVFREAGVLENIGMLYEKKSEFKQSIKYYKQAQNIIGLNGKELRDPIEEPVAYFTGYLYANMANVYKNLNESTAELEYLEKALLAAKETGESKLEYELYAHFADVYERLGNIDNALLYHKRYAELREEVLGTEKQKAIAEMQAKFDVESAEREKELFRVKNVELTAALEEVRRLNDRLTKLNTEKNEVLGVVAHDLQGPLSGVKLVAEMVQAHYKQMPDVELQHQLGTIAQTSERMLSITTALLQTQALEQQEAGSELRERVDVSEEVRSVLERFRASAHRKGIELECSVPSGAVELECNRSGLQQVLENLLSNGIKFSPHGKRVGIEVKLRGGRVQIGVWDEGPGISTKDKRKLFGKFARLSAVPTGGESSTGLGLWIVSQRVSQLGGSIRCISKAGAGARFVVELPQQAEAL